MKILLLAPFFTGSHRRWAEGLQQHLAADVHILSLAGRHWKWRMHGAAVSFAEQFRELGFRPDLILATDMLDLASFLALSRPLSDGIPAAVYFHENQLSYPWSPTDPDTGQQRDRHYAFINYTSALAADACFFNSAFHQGIFLQQLPDFLHAFPDHQDKHRVAEIAAKSSVLPLGLDLSAFQGVFSPCTHHTPTILWNHRWEYDKAPETFFKTLFQLQEQGYDFQLIVLGEGYRKQPSIFSQAKAQLAKHIMHWGFVDNRRQYHQLLRQADLLPVFSHHDFFGISVVEAIAAGVFPILPKRLAYPEHIPTSLASQHLFDSDELVGEKLRNFLQKGGLQADQSLVEYVQKYDWRQLAPQYLAALTAVGKKP
ncbi:MAG: DUF3524 domain-containing protein [Bacteroidota bacterium]